MKHSTPYPAGKVLLVGAGPGDPDLLTIKAAAALARADLVVHDGLVDQAILALANPKSEMLSVAKQRSHHSVPQQRINQILVEAAQTGKTVVLLKCGYPFIFGRGGEEVEACRAEGVAVEVIPGISAAVGCAAEAALPLTHRDASSVVSFVAGQCKGLSDQNWSGLAGKGRTLVIYMGVATAEDIAEKLIADGVSPAMPVAVLERGTRAGARALRSLLADLGGLMKREGVKSPAIIVVGEVVTRSDAEDRLWTLAQAVEASA